MKQLRGSGVKSLIINANPPFLEGFEEAGKPPFQPLSSTMVFDTKTASLWGGKRGWQAGFAR
jgi:hypothetical protein